MGEKGILKRYVLVQLLESFQMLEALHNQCKPDFGSILGPGYFGSDALIFNNPEISGVMADAATSANDPIFLNHYAMVDCIFET